MGSGKLFSYFPPIQSISFSTRSFSTSRDPRFNVLFFCPRNEKHLESFNDEYPKFIKSTNPESISVTDTAHNPENNSHAVKLLLKNDITPSMIIPHIVLIGHSKKDADQRIRFFHENGIKSMFVIRGNPPVLDKGMEYNKHPEGYEDMPHLMRRIKELSPSMKIIVAGYPGKHPFAKSFSEDLDVLKSKIDSGADAIITQHFFDKETFLTFIEQCQKRSINVPIIPSVMPIGNPKYLFAFSRGANVDIPAQITQILFKHEGATVEDSFIKDKDVEKVAIEYTSQQIQSLTDLRLPQVPKINVYAANNLRFLGKIFNTLGLNKSLSEDKGR